jgi:nicotinamide phosphoribosyltransferase
MTVIAEAPTNARKYAPGASFFQAAVDPLFATDAYKLGHAEFFELASSAGVKGFPNDDGTMGTGGGVTRMYANWTNRKSRIDGVDCAVHFGLQAFCQSFLTDSWNNFFSSPIEDVVARFEKKRKAILGPHEVNSDRVRALHALGYLPLRFCAVPEGTLVPIGVPSFTIENTHDDFFWLPNYIESPLSAAIWQASTTATKAWHMRQLLNRQAMHTGSPMEAVDFQMHDFSMRGMAGLESASASGAAHLLSSKGSDTMIAMDWVDYFYPGSPEDEIILMSVPATEHSVMCNAIAKIGEQEMMRRLMDLVPTGYLSVVADSRSLWEVLDVFLPALKPQIMARDGKLVIRPDSGDPVKIICGNPDAEPGTTEHKGLIQSLWETFGGTLNAKNFKVLDSHIGAIYGDGMYYDRVQEIGDKLAAKGFASVNIVYGVGSWSYSMVSRDSLGSAVKATASVVDGGQVEIFKDPITDDGTKKSAKGRLAVGQMMSGKIYLIEHATPEQEARSLLQPVWENGEFIKFQSFHDVRETLKRSTGIRQRMLSRDQH